MTTREEAERVAVPGHEGLYEIDANGNVFSLPRTFTRLNRGRTQTIPVHGRRLARTYSRKGYPQVRLCKNNAGRTLEVHRLVCRVFHGEPEPWQEVAHLDGDKTNPRADNLAWVTRSENHSHKRLHGTHLIGEAVPNSVLTSEQAVDVVSSFADGESQRSIARRLGVCRKTIQKILKGELWADYTGLAVASLLKEGRT